MKKYKKPVLKITKFEIRLLQNGTGVSGGSTDSRKYRDSIWDDDE